MLRSSSDLFKDAGDMARRTNLQIIVVGAGLLLVWLVTLEDGFARIQDQIYRLAQFQTRSRNLSGIIDERSRELQELQRRQLQHKQAEQTIREQKQPGTASANPISLSETTKIAKLERQIKEYGRSAQEVENSIAEATKTLNEKVNFDIGQGIKLPFTFGKASLAWIIFLVALLFRVKLQREKFWQLVSNAVVRLRATGNPQVEPHLVDMPIWLAPVPSRGLSESVSHDDLKTVVGWIGDSKGRMVLNWLIGLGVVVALLRVAWIGFVVNGLAVDRLQGSPLVTSGILASTAVGLVATAWLCWPSTVIEAEHMVDQPRRDRRVLLGASIGLGLLFLLRSNGAMTYYSRKKEEAEERAKQGALRYTPRNASARQADLSKSQLPMGFYQNQRSGKLYYVPPDGIIKGGRKLAAANLERIELPFDSRFASLGMLKQSRGSTPKLIALRSSRSILGPLSDGIEELALSKARERQPEAAFAVLHDFITKSLYSSRSVSAKPVLKQLDLAAGIAIRHNLENQLDRLVALLRDIELRSDDPQHQETLRLRVAQWTSPEGERWRRNRWRSQPHPLRWNGRRYDA